MKAMNKLKSPQVIKYIIEEVQKEGVVGEEDSIAILTLKIMLRLVRNANPTSSNILVSDTTGGGKDFLTKNVCKVLLEDEVTCFHRTSMSPKVLNYWQPYIGKQPVSWNNRVLYLEDPEDDAIKSQAFKVMASGGTKMTVLKDQKVINRKIDGKPVMVVTSMKTQIDDEGQRRWDAIRIDTSPELSKLVVRKSLERDMGLIPPNPPDETFRSLLRSLREYEVVIPWAKDLMPTFKNPRMVERTQVNKLLDYIKASAIIHQASRKKNKHGQLIAEKDDYELARLAYILLRNKEGNALNKQEETLLDYLQSKKEPVKLSQITTDLKGVSRTWLYANKDMMISKNIISTVTKFDAGANKEIEHLEASYKIQPNTLPSGKILFGLQGYLPSGQFYDEVNQERKKEGLKPLFKKVI